MADVARDYSALVGRPAGKVSPLRPLFTALTASLSAIFRRRVLVLLLVQRDTSRHHRPGYAASGAGAADPLFWLTQRLRRARASSRKRSTPSSRTTSPDRRACEVARLVRHRLLRACLSRLHADSRHFRRCCASRSPAARSTLVRQRAAQLHRCHLRAHLGGQLDRHTAVASSC